MTLWVWPLYQTVPAWGYVTGGMKTSRFSRGEAVAELATAAAVAERASSFMKENMIMRVVVWVSERRVSWVLEGVGGEARGCLA